ncbi:mannosyltransferase [Acuticoccus sediminis]|uniref:Mannosyltransferase n=1 Tax=Acuticoccus sediminis TaxID=2184697 RepID=A0A8B2P1M9_9HYPH|nr:ABC transporter ATP-binding protein [Acuticoccus sediminis]RAI02177.1 mannosyltransferase [Acuticoccus sediminis]
MAARTDIRCENLSLTFPSRSGGSTLALDALTCRFEAGKVSAIIGPSGCGKSTMLQVVRGLLGATSGEVRFVNRQTGHSVLPPAMATVWQSFNLFPWLTLIDNVAFGLEVAGVPRRERRARAEAALARVNLSGFEHKHPGQLSGGMRQRVGIARALVMEPEILLLDEPFGALDAQTRLVLQEEVGGIVQATGASAILVTHSIEEAILLGDTIFVMTARPGRIAREINVELPRPRTMAQLSEPEFVALFAEIYELLKSEVLKAMASEREAA